MNVLLDYARAEQVVRNSRFIAEVFPVSTQALARDTLRDVKLRYKDAAHVVHAFVTGAQGETNGMSDDGEPGGTAGRPVLDVLRGSGITNILLTVTRYFGGTLLGTGGLVRAYGDSAKQVLAVCRSEPLVAKQHISFSADYPVYEAVRRRYEQYHVSALTESYGAAVTVQADIWAEEAAAFAADVKNMSKGKTEVQITPCI